MVRVSGSASSARADGVSAMAAEAPPPRGPVLGLFAHLATRPLTPAPASPAYNCQRPAASGMTCVRRLAGARKPASSTGSSSRPEPRPGRARARFTLLLPALALLLGALGLFAAVPAQAQTTVLVSNIGQGTSGVVGTATAAWSQQFTTGSNVGGYTLSSIEAVTNAADATQRGTIRAELWSAASGGGPDRKVADLTVPSTVSAGTVSFAAPANTTLTASTTYHFILYTVGNFNLTAAYNGSGNLDSGGQTGWSMGNQWSYARDTPQTAGASWIEESGTDDKTRIRVKGTVVVPPEAEWEQATYEVTETDADQNLVLTINFSSALETNPNLPPGAQCRDSHFLLI